MARRSSRSPGGREEGPGQGLNSANSSIPFGIDPAGLGGPRPKARFGLLGQTFGPGRGEKKRVRGIPPRAEGLEPKPKGQFPGRNLGSFLPRGPRVGPKGKAGTPPGERGHRAPNFPPVQGDWVRIRGPAPVAGGQGHTFRGPKEPPILAPQFQRIVTQGPVEPGLARRARPIQDSGAQRGKFGERGSGPQGVPNGLGG